MPLDPYVKVVISYYDDAIVFKWKTSVKCKVLAPVYDERFECKVTEEVSRDMDKITISLCVIDHDYVLQNDVMGVVSIGNNVDTKLGRKHWRQGAAVPQTGNQFLASHSTGDHCSKMSHEK